MPRYVFDVRHDLCLEDNPAGVELPDSAREFALKVMLGLVQRRGAFRA